MRSSTASNTLHCRARHLSALAILAAALMCASAPAGAAFVDNGNGTISDSVTGLTWNRTPFTTCGGTGAALRNWQSALTAASTASGCNYRGHNDWRLPNIKELESLVDVTQSATAPAVFADGLIAAPSTTTYFWSSTTYPASQAGVISALTVFTYDGNFTPLQIGNNAYALLVRGGQSFDMLHPPPMVSAASVAPIGYADATFNATSSAAGAGFVVVVAAGSPAPTAAQVISVAQAGGASYTSATGTVAVTASGNDFVSAGVSAAFPLSGFVPATAYDAYFVAKDTFGNTSALTGPVEFATLSNATTTAIGAIVPNPLTFAVGAAAAVSVNVTRGTDQAAPSGGTVVVNNTTDNTSCTIDLASAASCAIAVAGAGDKSLSATFASADPVHFANSATAAPSTLTVSPAGQTIAFGLSPSIAVGGSGSVLASGGASGNPVVFATTSTNCLVTANGTVTGLAAGPCVVTATQAGSADYLPAAPATQTLTIGQASSAVVLTSNLPSPTFGQTVVFTATVASANTGAGGTVAFGSSTFLLAGCAAQPLVGNTATCAAANIPAGLQTVTAAYSGDANTSASSSPAFTQLVAKAGTTTALTPPSAIAFGQSVDVAATVAIAAPGAGVPTGSIAVSDGGVAAGDSCTIVLPADHCTLTPSTPGNKTLTATYTPDALAGANMTGSSATAALSIDPATSSVVLGSSANPSVFGQSVALTALVTTSNPNAGGTVTFSEGGATLAGCAPAPLTSGMATCQTAALSAGPHVLVAAYSGDADTPASNNAASPLQQAVFKASTAVTLTPPGPAVLGSAVGISATVAVVAPGAGTLTGTITVGDGDNGPGDSCVIHLPATTCALAPSSTGTKTLTAAYTPDAAADASFYSSSATGSLTVGAAATSVEVSSSAEPAVFGQSVTLTAKVVSLGTSPSGNVAFTDASHLSIDGCSAVAVDNGLATCRISTLAVGTHSIVAAYQGDASHAGSSNADTPLPQTVNKAATAVTLAPPASIALGASAVVEATVAVVAPGAGGLSGTITVSDGGAGAGDACAIVLPATSCSLTPSSTGAKTLTAIYTPDATADPNFAGSSASGSLTVTEAASGATLATSANPSVFGQSVVLTATVTGAAGNPPPTGSVTFRDGGTVLCNAVVLAAGGGGATAACTSAAFAVGSHALSASYTGDANHLASTGTLTQIVNAAATALSLDAPASLALGQSATVTVHLAATAPGAGTPSGNIVVGDGSASCTITLPAAGCALQPTSAGTKTLTATYAGDGNFGASRATAILTVTTTESSMTLTSTPNPSTAGQTVTFSAVVAAAANSGTSLGAVAPSATSAAAAAPTGTVEFRDGATLLAAVVLDANGRATYATHALAAGTHTITANYSGDGTTAAATATSVQQVDAAVAPAVPAPALSVCMLTLLALAIACAGVARARGRATRLSA